MMLRSRCPLLWLLLLLLASVRAEDEDEDIVDLYELNSPVFHLDHDNFASQLANQKQIWLIEFYNSWCGHCQLYAPTWVKVAQAANRWSQVVRVGAINCARTQNRRRVCLDQGVSGYPWVKMFPPYSNASTAGEHLRHKDVETMLNGLVDTATSIQNTSHPVNWPHLGLLGGPLSEFLGSPEPLHVLILEESAEGRLGRQLILDMWAAPGGRYRARVARALQPPPDLTELPERRPLLVVWRRGSRHLLDPPLAAEKTDELQLRRFYSSTLRELAGLSAEQLPEESAPSTAAVDVVGTVQLSEDDAVYMADLETALRYSVSHELVAKREVDVPALKLFVQILSTHFPGRQSVRDALSRLDQFVQRLDNSPADVKQPGEQLENYLEQNRLPSSGAGSGWVGCRGSQTKYRGYTCALWTLFHTLTVQAARADPAAPSILPAIHGYVKYFFGCSHCSQHFQQMAADDGLFNVRTASDAVLWLWRAHNKVNRRLHGELTEDPQHPKQQFPSEKLCPACHDTQGGFLEPVVLTFLSNFYGPRAIRENTTSSPRVMEQPPHLVAAPDTNRQLNNDSDHPPVPAAAVSVGAERTSSHVRVGSNSPQIDRVDSDGILHHSAIPVEVVSLGAARSSSDVHLVSSSPLRADDVTLCALLWVFSIVTLVVAFLLLRMRRRRCKSSIPFYGFGKKPRLSFF